MAEKNIYLGNTSKLLDFGDKKYFVAEQFFQTGDISYVWGVRNGIAYEEDISGMCSSLAQVDASTELTFIHSTYDASAFDMTGHTWRLIVWNRQMNWKNQIIKGSMLRHLCRR